HRDGALGEVLRPWLPGHHDEGPEHRARPAPPRMAAARRPRRGDPPDPRLLPQGRRGRGAAALPGPGRLAPQARGASPRPRRPSTPRGTPASIVAPRLLDVRERVDRLGRFGRRNAYFWRDGVRWRSRTYAELRARIHGASERLTREGLRAGDPILLQGPE